MVSIMFTSFVVVLMFIIQDSSADIHQVTAKKILMFAAGSGFTVGAPSAIGKEILDAVPTPQAAKNGKTGGRKMMKRRVLMKEIVKDRNIINKEEASKISGAAAHKGKRKLNIKCKMSGRGSIHHRMGRAEMSSFVALNADYHAPKSHPSKNN